MTSEKWVAITIKKKKKRKNHGGGKFENIAVGCQLEMPYRKHLNYFGMDKDIDPKIIVYAVVVTHIFYDPVDDKKYICTANIRKDGTYGKPNEKRTTRGLAVRGWEKAGKDWIVFFKTIKDETNNVIGISND